ncbi:hypothetical protein SUGI_1137210 [Cryptomeria japonica]|nr:hypothetical protein SUGI_1137210 [Cryptomeria japonica]
MERCLKSRKCEVLQSTQPWRWAGRTFHCCDNEGDLDGEIEGKDPGLVEVVGDAESFGTRITEKYGRGVRVGEGCGCGPVELGHSALACVQFSESERAREGECGVVRLGFGVFSWSLLFIFGGAVIGGCFIGRFGAGAVRGSPPFWVIDLVCMQDLSMAMQAATREPSGTSQGMDF